MKLTPFLRIALAVTAAASLVAGLTGGLARLGVVAPVGDTADMHGAIMASGFFGTLISLERAVADGRLAALLVPAVSAAGGILLLFGYAEATAPLFLVAGLGLTLLTGLAAWKLPTLFTGLMTAGAALWPLGTLFWMSDRTLPEVGYVWLGFLILTVVAERIELSRLLRPTLAARGLLVLLVILFALALGLGQPWNGSALLSVTLAGIALWLLREDIALRTVRTTGFARFSALLLISGYGWLIVAAASLYLLPPGEAVYGHDAAIHAIAVGFILSMVFAHAPIILPAVTGAPVRYVPVLYLPAALLQIAIGLRIVFDAVEATEYLHCPAWLTIAAIVAYVALLLGTMVVRPKAATA
ncbi:hypothetical protein CXZ10_06085 [Pleomorphomonas diazotrophica]|uniref:NnrS family protein n=1 Tax=Pleomorphomonas diazotrophica TaxID=1166257 RepID=A0A1I4Q5S4_9HYPH|nr:hypothetical protein [Pleomorphomonas diazotrophica]PKR90913.1 hypothetical protein CXZ10_06085 [Pleomorphomonas diazotrophica]SFM35431.1 hypothetical protein SAMN05192571_10192 [Pleomorphomonas diazotrophica]